MRLRRHSLSRSLRPRSVRALAGVLAVGVLLLVPSTGLATSAPRAALQNFTCAHALNPIDRSVGVTAVMRPLAGTRRMAVRFSLLFARNGSSPTRSLRAGDLGTWIAPHDPTLGQLPGDIWNLEKSVVDLATPGSYRFRVQFRWQGPHHQSLGTAVRYTRRCQLRELRPDLLVRSIAVSAIPDHPNENLYSAVIANNGNSAAGPFEVLSAPADGSSTMTASLPGLGAHASRTEDFVGPVCSASTAPTITADSADQVDDLNRANNAMTATCPAAGG